MYVRFDGKTYRIGFVYGVDKQGRKITTCEVWEGYTSNPDDNTVEEYLISKGTSTCSKEDNFNKVVGRKVALTEAVSYLDKHVRTAIWDKYKETSKYVA